MATFEKRYNQMGDLVAIRAKVRRAGSPHLSRTFKVSGTSESASARALREAQRWVKGLTESLEGHASVLMPAMVEASLDDARIVGAGRSKQPPPAGLSAAFAASAGSGSRRRDRDSAGARVSDADIEALAVFAEGALANLVRLEIEVGLAPHELVALRWQHVLFDSCSLSVVGASGAVLRRLQLTPTALELLLRMPGRKYGLIFAGLEPIGLEASLRRAVRAAGLDKKFPWPVLITLRREAALRWMARGLDRMSVARVMGVNDLDVVLQPPVRTGAARKRMQP